ncbi:MAG: serine hydrolase, partial [Candidatus Moraniibacteriota bacterium]
MRFFLLILVIVGIFALVGKGQASFAVLEETLRSFWPSSEDVKKNDTEILGATAAQMRQPIITESRELATSFQPELREYSPRLSIVTAHASIIMDAESGKILYEKNAHEERQIASLTKLFTAVLVLEQIKDLDELVTIDEEAVYSEGTRVGCPRSGFCNGVRLKPGEQLTVRNLLKAALMNSANDAAVALGKHIGKTQGGFAKIMNERAKELGLVNSHFCTPSGLEPDGREHECYSSAAD